MDDIPAGSCECALTFQQQWLLSLLRGHASWNCVAVRVFHLEGALNISVLQRSLDEVVRRHGALRTRIVVTDGVARSYLDQWQAGQLHSISAEDSCGAQVDAKAPWFVEALCALSRAAPLGTWFRAQLLALSDRDHWLVLGFHRLIADCTGIDQVLRELWLIFGELLQGRAAPPLGEPSQYADYALWQAATDGDWRRRHEGYWTSRLLGARPLKWPPDDPADVKSPTALGKIERQFGEELSAALREFARVERTLAANVMMAIYVAVLWRWCGQVDFMLTLKIAGRDSGHKSVVGYFAGIIYLRVNLERIGTFRELLKSIGDEFFRALAHQDFCRNAMQRPELLAGTFFQWITGKDDGASEQQWSAGTADCEIKIQRFKSADLGGDWTAVPPGMVDVEVTFFDTPAGIRGSGVYRADRLAAGTLERFMADLHSATAQFIRNPLAPVKKITTSDPTPLL